MIRVCHKMLWYQCKISLLCVRFWKPSIGICLCNWNSNRIIKSLRTHNWNINLRQERPFSKGYWEGPFISFATTLKRTKVPFGDRMLDHSQWTLCKITGTIWIQEMCWIQGLWLQIQSMAFLWILATNAGRLSNKSRVAIHVFLYCRIINIISNIIGKGFNSLLELHKFVKHMHERPLANPGTSFSSQKGLILLLLVLVAQPDNFNLWPSFCSSETSWGNRIRFCTIFVRVFVRDTLIKESLLVKIE